MKYNEPILVQIKPVNYHVFEENVDDIDISDVPRDGRFDTFDTTIPEDDPRYGTACGGRMDWILHVFPEGGKDSGDIKVQLMRIWATQMYTQMAAGLSYTNEIHSTIRPMLTEEELDMLAKINNKIVGGIYEEMWSISNSMVRKKKISGLNFTENGG
jgi:hypothetical protein